MKEEPKIMHLIQAYEAGMSDGREMMRKFIVSEDRKEREIFDLGRKTGFYQGIKHEKTYGFGFLNGFFVTATLTITVLGILTAIFH